MINGTRSKLLAEDLSSAIRRHPHLGNVMTHISSGRWPRVDEALQPLFMPARKTFLVSPLTHNILELICDNRGTTGRIMQPFFQAFLSHSLEAEDARKISAWVRRLRQSQDDYPTDDDGKHLVQHASSFERLAS